MREYRISEGGNMVCTEDLEVMREHILTHDIPGSAEDTGQEVGEETKGLTIIDE